MKDLQTHSSLLDLSTLMDEAIKAAVMDIESKKCKLIEERVIQLAKPTDFNSLKDESKKRFPRISAIVLNDNTEKWYWNDGSDNGILLIEFHQKANEYLQEQRFNVGFYYK